MSQHHFVNYTTPQLKKPCTVCFSTTKRNNKQYVSYGAVIGSKRIRRELDMPCSVATYDKTLQQIAKTRHNHKPIEAEFCVLESHEENITQHDICRALMCSDEGSVRFWEHNLMLFGTYNKDNLVEMNKDHSPKQYLDSYMERILNKDVVRHRFHKTRKMKQSDYYEHMFSIACRFQISEDNSVIIYGTAIHIGLKSLSIMKQNSMWEQVQNNLIHHPQYWFGVPDSVHFNKLCNMDGWS